MTPWLTMRGSERRRAIAIAIGAPSILRTLATRTGVAAVADICFEVIHLNKTKFYTKSSSEKLLSLGR